MHIPLDSLRVKKKTVSETRPGLEKPSPTASGNQISIPWSTDDAGAGMFRDVWMNIYWERHVAAFFIKLQAEKHAL